MARLPSYLWASALGAIALSTVLASCTTDDDPDDGDAGAGGEAGSDTGGTGNTGNTSGSGGTSGGSSEGGAGGDPVVGGAGGEGGAVDENFCELAGGAGGAGGATSVDGRSCAEYCTDFFANCETSTEFEDRAECLMSCRFFGNEQLCCRAAAVLESDCEAAAGNATCN